MGIYLFYKCQISVVSVKPSVITADIEGLADIKPYIIIKNALFIMILSAKRITGSWMGRSFPACYPNYEGIAR
jgi:hypothetical protein